MTRLSNRLLNWYNKNKRPLPWRGVKSHYAVWVSEIMLQQTRVETVIPFYEEWLKRFPTIRALADASEREVLHVWEGLGYYSRARNFHKAAKIVMNEHGGQLPRDVDELRSLPGIGRYTAGALASILFGMDEPALDGNLKRVYARLFDVSLPVGSTEGESLLWKLARDNLPRGKAADFNQALMDLGASICLPKNPRCLLCPVMKLCRARENGTQHLRPVKKLKKVLPQYIHAAAVVVKRGRVLLAKRPSEGLLGGMWEFPNARVDQDPARELAKALRSIYNLRLVLSRVEEPGAKRIVPPLAVIEHTYSHFKVITHAYRCELTAPAGRGRLKWVASRELKKYPMGRIDRQISEKIK